MLEVNIIDDSNDKNNVEVGQIRYNERGMYVLIANEEYRTFDAIVLNEGFSVKPFNWSSKGLSAYLISAMYPNIAKGKLEIIK